MATRVKLGAVVEQSKGYCVRQMGTNKGITIQGKDKKVFQHNGTYGVYAGRKKVIIDGFKQPSEALTYINDKY